MKKKKKKEKPMLLKSNWIVHKSTIKLPKCELPEWYYYKWTGFHVHDAILNARSFSDKLTTFCIQFVHSELSCWTLYVCFYWTVQFHLLPISRKTHIFAHFFLSLHLILLLFLLLLSIIQYKLKKSNLDMVCALVCAVKNDVNYEHTPCVSIEIY